MIVLSVIGGILGLVFLYWVVEKVNDISYRESEYEYFSTTTAGFVVVGYYFLFFGYKFYETASHATHGDILNGVILMIIGAILVGINIFNNYTYEKGRGIRVLLFTVIQLVVYLGLAFVGIFIVAIAIAALAQTKPVYVLNND